MNKFQKPVLERFDTDKLNSLDEVAMKVKEEEVSLLIEFFIEHNYLPLHCISDDILDDGIISDKEDFHYLLNQGDIYVSFSKYNDKTYIDWDNSDYGFPNHKRILFSDVYEKD